MLSALTNAIGKCLPANPPSSSRIYSHRIIVLEAPLEDGDEEIITKAYHLILHPDAKSHGYLEDMSRLEIPDSATKEELGRPQISHIEFQKQVRRFVAEEVRLAEHEVRNGFCCRIARACLVYCAIVSTTPKIGDSEKPPTRAYYVDLLNESPEGRRLTCNDPSSF